MWKQQALIHFIPSRISFPEKCINMTYISSAKLNLSKMLT